MTDTDALTSVLAEPGDWTFAYIDGHSNEPTPAEEERRRSVRDRLADAGAPQGDIDAVDAVLRGDAGMPSPSTHYLLVRGGDVVVDEKLTGARLGPERVGHAVLPPVLPLLRHRATDTRYLVVEAGREGARIRSERAGRAGTGVDTEIEGRTEDLPKVQAGGWSHLRYQERSEEIWKQNQDDVAAAVDRHVRRDRPRFVIVSGDVRARQLLIDALAPASRDLVVEVDAHTKADGADDTALDEAIEQALQDVQRQAEDSARDRAAVDDGARRAAGTADVVAALQQAQVDTLLLDARLIDLDAPLVALDAAPWVSTAEEPMPGAQEVARVAMAEALARAALLTDARVLVVGDEPAEGQPRPDGPAEAPVALLRWTENAD